MSTEEASEDQVGRFRQAIKDIKFNSRLIWRSLKDSQTPLLVKLFYPLVTFGAWLFYLVMPETLIALLVPLIGPFIAPFLSTPVEDIFVAPFVAAYAVGLLFLELIPAEVVRRHRQRLLNPQAPEPTPITNPSRMLIVSNDRVGERIQQAYERSQQRGQKVQREKERDLRNQRKHRP